MVKGPPATRETRVRSLGWEDPLEQEMATHSRTLTWKIPWMEEPGRLQSMGSQRVGHNWATSLFHLVRIVRGRPVDIDFPAWRYLLTSHAVKWANTREIIEREVSKAGCLISSTIEADAPWRFVVGLSWHFGMLRASWVSTHVSNKLLPDMTMNIPPEAARGWGTQGIETNYYKCVLSHSVMSDSLRPHGL